MHASTLFSVLLALCTLSTTSALRSAPKVKLSNIKSLTLRDGAKTSHRRVDAIPQLRCIAGAGCPHYTIDVMRCKNSGADYDDENIQWTCTASLPEEFKLGSTDVICEGYDSPDDPYILKGSCGVEYRLALTEKGMEKYGKGKGWFGGGHDGEDGGARNEGPASMGDRIVAAVFWMVFIGVALWIVLNAVRGWAANAGAAGGNRPGWGGGGGGGGWGGNDTDDPPPPYDYQPGRSNKQAYGGTPQQQQGWRPGFWSGAMGGAAAGYAAGNWANRGNRSRTNAGGGGLWDRGEGSSRSSSGSSSGSPSYSSTRHESTGFGSTSRR